MKTRIEVEWQSWVGKGHGYKPFVYEEVQKSGELSAITRYEYCLRRFLKLSACDRERGIIFGGIDYDFSFQEVPYGEEKD